MRINREQLKKLLLMALSSTNEHEMLAAVRALKNRIKKQGKDIHWFADQFDENAGLPPPLTPTVVVDWQQQLAFAVDNIWRLGMREQDFVGSLYRQVREHGSYWYPSGPQLKWLGNIYNRLKIVVSAGL